uniref:non-homologous end-joining DNA ligase n=1 Tax=Actinokineospora sp. CA-119265 TaxID=3239890 RepID=UPI003F49885C
MPAVVSPMLATLDTPPAGEGWAVEWKWDGLRAVVGVAAGRVRVTSRTDREVTASYPELAALSGLVDEPVLLDGEIVALDARSVPDFPRLQRRMNVTVPPAGLVAEVPVLLFVFDLLSLGGRSLLREPYLRRRELLDGLGLAVDPVRTPAPVDLPAVDALDVAREHGLEGIVAKRVDSVYEPGRRSRAWVKTPLRHTQEVLVGGWVPGQGRRVGRVGALLCGAWDQHGELRYLGRVGTGFTDRALDDVEAELRARELADSPFAAGSLPRAEARGARWCRPDRVAEVEHRQLITNPDTGEHRLRHPSWRGWRPDRLVDEASVVLGE